MHLSWPCAFNVHPVNLTVLACIVLLYSIIQMRYKNITSSGTGRTLRDLLSRVVNNNHLWDLDLRKTQTHTHKFLDSRISVVAVRHAAIEREGGGVRGSDWGGKKDRGSKGRKGENGSACLIYFPLFHWGARCINRQELSPNPPTDVKAHCLFQSWQKGSTGHFLCSLAHPSAF